MPLLSVNGVGLHVEDSGGDGAPIVFSHGLLFSTRMFDAQVAALRDRYRCVAYDHRGQGQSEVPSLRSMAIEDCYRDAVALIETLGLAPCHFVGLSMGGFVGMRIAARRPELLRTLALLDTSADAEPAENVPRYRLLNAVARLLGPWAVAGKVMPIVFSRTFLADGAREAERAEWKRRIGANRRSVWRAVNGVIERGAIYDELKSIRAPTLVVVGDEDVATAPPKAERIAGAVAGARLVRVPAAGHSSPIEQPAAITAELERLFGDR